MQRFVHFIETKLPLLINLSGCLTDIKIHHCEISSVFKLDEADEGWLLRRDVEGSWRRMCWLPFKRRKHGQVIGCDGQRVVICTRDGLMTILDFSDI
jgi:hypothetical protein